MSFDGGKITVNAKDSVDLENITFIASNVEGRTIWTSRITFGVEYLEDGMEDPEFAEFIFANWTVAQRFWRDLRRACRKCKDVDGINVNLDVKQ